MHAFQMERKEGVTPSSPPQSLRFNTLKGSKRVKLNADLSQSGGSGRSKQTVNTDSLDLLASLLAARGDHRSESSSLSHEQTPLSSPPNESHIEGYINYLGIMNKEDTLNILLANGFTSHKVFKSSGLLRSEVRELGLTLGVVTVLFDNVAKYDQYLANNK